MAESSRGRDLTVPAPLVARLDRMVADGEYATFAEAGLAMLELGIMEHDGHVLPPGGPAPPEPRRDIAPPGPRGGGVPGPRVAGTPGK